MTAKRCSNCGMFYLGDYCDYCGQSFGFIEQNDYEESESDTLKKIYLEIDKIPTEPPEPEEGF